MATVDKTSKMQRTLQSVKMGYIGFAFKQLFYNYVIGMPYANTAMQITNEDITSHIYIPKEETHATDDYIAHVVGIDWGEPSWVLVLGIRNDFSIQIVSARKFYRSNQRELYDVTHIS